MRRLIFSPLAILALIQFIVVFALSPPSIAQDWQVRKIRGTIRVVDLYLIDNSVMENCAERLVTVDKENNVKPCLARDWRWLDDRTIEFKLRRGVTFHNGEEFNAEAVRINWEAYKSMESPTVFSYMNLSDDTMFEIIDRYTIRFTLPEQDGLAFAKLWWFRLGAPAFFKRHKPAEKNWLFFPEAGPWGTGPFELVEGSLHYGRPSERIVLEAYEDYWDPQYPMVRKVIFENTLIGNREEAMRLCREEEAVDLVSFIRPLDTLKVAESPHAKVVKSKGPFFLAGYFNQRKEQSKWRDIRLRKALNYAINRKELWKYAAKGNAHNLGGFIPPGARGHNSALSLYGYDTDKARSLLAEAGYPGGFEMKIITMEAWKLVAQIMSKMLERIGLKVTLEVVTWPGFAQKTYIPSLVGPPEEQEWDLAIAYWGDFYAHTGAGFLALVLIEDSDWRWIEYDPVYEEMWKDMAKEVNAEMQAEKIQKMAEYVYSNAHFLFIYSPLMLYAVNKEVDFVPQKLGFVRLKETSVTDNHWSVRGQTD